MGSVQRTEIAEAHRRFEKDGVCKTYFAMEDGTRKSDSRTYMYRLEQGARWPNAEKKL